MSEKPFIFLLLSVFRVAKIDELFRAKEESPPEGLYEDVANVENEAFMTAKDKVRYELTCSSLPPIRYQRHNVLWFQILGAIFQLCTVVYLLQFYYNCVPKCNKLNKEMLHGWESYITC